MAKTAKSSDNTPQRPTAEELLTQAEAALSADDEGAALESIANLTTWADANVTQTKKGRRWVSST
jgi:hypothetical protein